MTLLPGKIVIFAQVPPPLHGQSTMVDAGLKCLRRHDPSRVVHVDSRWSSGLDDIGSASWSKLWKTLLYIRQALGFRFRTGARTLYYVPGPVKPSAVLRDWMVLGLLRPFFPATVFHWHAVGQGEWAHGSDRARLCRSDRVDRIGRAISRLILRQPALSICVSEASDHDARAVNSTRIVVVENGIEDPCPGYDERIQVERDRGREEDSLRVLFLSHGTREKGILDAIEAVGTAATANPEIRFLVTLAGGLSGDVRQDVEERIRSWEDELGTGRIRFKLEGFVTGADKDQLWASHDVLLFPSYWESFGLVAVEALAWGIPVVAAASDGILGVLGSDDPRVVPIGDIPRLATALAAVALQLRSGDAARIAAECRRRFENRFSRRHFEGGFVAAMTQDR